MDQFKKIITEAKDIEVNFGDFNVNQDEKTLFKKLKITYDETKTGVIVKGTKAALRKYLKDYNDFSDEDIAETHPELG